MNITTNPSVYIGIDSSEILQAFISIIQSETITTFCFLSYILTYNSRIQKALPLANDSNSTIVDQSSPQAVEKWYHSHLHHAKPKIIKLHFFVHDNVTAEKPNAVLTAPAGAIKASTAFGSTYVMDDPMTVDSDPNSKIIGRAQGTFTFVSHADPVLSMVVKLVFTEGEYQGSSLTISGNNPITQNYREMPILGGTGVFRLARGTATVNTVIVDIAKLNDILEYHVIVQHY